MQASSVDASAKCKWIKTSVDNIKGNDGGIHYKFWQLLYVFVGVYNDERVNTMSMIFALWIYKEVLVLNKKAVNNIKLRVSAIHGDQRQVISNGMINYQKESGLRLYKKRVTALFCYSHTVQCFCHFGCIVSSIYCFQLICNVNQCIMDNYGG